MPAFFLKEFSKNDIEYKKLDWEISTIFTLIKKNLAYKFKQLSKN
jgi:hypothetical protein